MTAASPAPTPVPGGRPEVELVRLRWWHLAQVMRLERELFGDERWSEEAFWSELVGCPPSLLDGPPRAYWAAVEGETVLGYAGVVVTADEAYVQTIGVTRTAQRRGIGRRLLQRLIDDAVAENAGSCWLEVRADNAAAQVLYAAFGFQARGRRRGYYQPSGTDAIVMSAELIRAAEPLERDPA
jgi:ribosomal-protein-alanine N-acetyltransferase